MKAQYGSFFLGKVMVRFENPSFMDAQTFLSIRAGFGHMRTFIQSLGANVIILALIS